MNDQNQGIFKVLGKINVALLTIEEIILVIITVGLCVVITVEVVCRYLLYMSTAWSEELARYLFIMLTFVGAAYACARREHIEIDIINQVLEKIPAIKNPANAKRIVNLVGDVTTIIFLLVFNSIFGSYMGQIGDLGLLSATMKIPMVWVYAMVYLGGVLSILHLVYLVICNLFKREPTNI